MTKTYTIRFRGRIAGSLEVSYWHEVTATLDHDSTDEEIILYALYEGDNNTGKKFEHIDLNNVKISE